MTITIEEQFIGLSGRYYAVLSVLPWVLLLVFALFFTVFLFIWLLMGDLAVSMQIVLPPFLMAFILLIPTSFGALYIIRWHGRRGMVVRTEGIVFVSPKGGERYLNWRQLSAVELRFAVPRVVQCTLVSGYMRFTFTNLEINLETRVPLKQVFPMGFDMERMRVFLYLLHQQSPELHWRVSKSFKDQFKIYYPPYDLEKLK